MTTWTLILSGFMPWGINFDSHVQIFITLMYYEIRTFKHWYRQYDIYFYWYLLLYVTAESEKVLVKNLFVCAGFVFTQVHLLI